MSGNKQIDISSCPNRVWDAVVVGAGPAGSICALTLAHSGHSVLLVDRKDFPRDKACGDLLIHDALTFLKRIGLYDRIREHSHQFDSARVFSPSGIEFGVPAEYMSIKRRDLDTLLVQAATEAGATFSQANLVDLQTPPGGPVSLTVTDKDSPVLARYCVLATGASVTLGNRLGMISRKYPTAMAIRCYVQSKFVVSDAVFSFDRSLLPGYAWIIPLGNNQYNVGCGVALNSKSGFQARDLKRKLADFMHGFPLVKQLMSEGEQISQTMGGALRCGLEGNHSVVKNRVICTGEAIGSTIPLTGAGIGKGMETGKLAALAVDAALRENDSRQLHGYEDRLDSDIRPDYRGYYIGQRWLSYPWLNDLVARRVRKSRYLQEQFQALASRHGSPTSLFCFTTLCQSFWK